MAQRINWIAGNHFGVDHGYFRPASTAPNTDIAPVAFPELERWMRWVWRIKKWRVTVFIDMEQVNAFSRTQITSTFDVNRVRSGDPLDPANFIRKEIDVPITTSNFVGAGVNISTYIFRTPLSSVTGAYWDPATKLFSPLLDATILLPSGRSFSTNPSFTRFPGNYLTQPANGTIDSLTLPFYYRTPQITEVLVIYTFQFDITPVEYYPYANLNGEQVWDTTTGAQINDPFG